MAFRMNVKLSPPTVPPPSRTPREDTPDLSMGRWRGVAWLAPLCALIGLLASGGNGGARAAQQDPFSLQRHQMVEQVRHQGVTEDRVLDAMERVPRHLFVPEPLRGEAYSNQPLPIGSEQSISQPYVSALMASLLELDGDEKVLEVGTGSGYDAAVLSRLARQVYTIEIVEELGQRARRTLRQAGFDNVHVRIGDGNHGWPEEAPFDAIILTTAPKEIPPALIDQLVMGGKIVVPLGSFIQSLEVYTKTGDGLVKRRVKPVRLGPMVSEPEGRP